MKIPFTSERRNIRFITNIATLLILSCILLNHSRAWASEPPQITLTEGEQSWLAMHHVVRVRVSNAPPYVFTQPSPSGIAVDYLEAIAKRIGFKFKYVEDTIGWSSSLQDVAGPHQYYDLLLVVNRSSERETDLALTKPYSSSRLVIFARRDGPLISDLNSLSGRSVAAEKSFVITERLKSNYPSIKIHEVDRSVDALNTVATGQADAYVGNLAISSYLIKENRLDNLMVMAPAPDDNYPVGMGIRKDWSELASIIDKGLASLPLVERNAINQKWGLIEFKDSEGVIPRWLLPVLGGILVFVFILIISAYILWVQVRTNAAKLLKGEKSLFESELRFREAMDATNDGLWDWHIMTGDVYFSPAYFRMLGYEPSELPNSIQTWLDIVHPDDVNAALAANQECIDNKCDRFSVEFRMKAKDGSSRWILGRGHAVTRNPDGRALRMIGTHVDITERKFIEDTLKSAKTQLADLLLERTKSLEEARRASQAKSMFLATMSHELRTPLNSIIGFTELVSSHAFGPIGEPQYVEHAEYANMSAKHLLDMINEMLDLSKIEAQTMRIEQARVPVLHSAKSSARTVESLAERTGITIHVVIMPEIPDLWADERAVRQILINLLSNAIKFNRAGGGIILTALEAGDFVEIVVADTGIGISHDVIPRVFQPFEQANNEYNRAHGGTGLGLAIVDGLVRLHGGTVTVASEVGKGTAITVRLPACKGAAGVRKDAEG